MQLDTQRPKGGGVSHSSLKGIKNFYHFKSKYPDILCPDPHPHPVSSTLVSCVEASKIIAYLLLSNFPGKHLRIFGFVFPHLLDDIVRRNLGFTAPYLARINTAGFSIPGNRKD